MEITLRPEEENDYRIVESLTREAFWNVHFPGCDEHLLVHHLRNAKAFVRALDFVAVCNNKIAGNIVYAESKIIDSDTEYTVLTFGPVSVLPEYQNRGIGGKLIEHTAKKAKEMGYRAIIIYGDIEYYKRFGFVESKKYNICNKENKFPAALLVLELRPHALDGIKGVFDEGSAYAVNGDELEAFEKGFVPKEKGFTPSQERFNELSKKYL
ncbi:MAG: N-acetyltransferase [Treponema sp.]|jgi:predicted N-acetyltransferase YhbS|nr:N-acetyltransferase [Treponema sp.]